MWPLQSTGSIAVLFALTTQPSSQTVPSSAADSTSRLTTLIERFQTDAGRDPTEANGWAIAVDAFAAMRTEDTKHWRLPDGSSRDKDLSPSAELAFRNSVAPLSKQEQAQLNLARAMADRYEKAGVFVKLDAMAKSSRAVRAIPGTVEYDAALKACGGATDPWDGRLISVLMPELGSSRALTRTLGLRFHDARKRGDVPECIRAFNQTLALARVISHGTTVIEQLVAVAIRSNAINRGTEALLDGFESAAFLSGIQAALDAQPMQPDPTLWIEGERLVALDTLRWLYASGVPKPSAIAALDTTKLITPAGKDKGFVDYFKLSGKFPSQDQTAPRLNVYLDGCLLHAQTPRRQRAGLTFQPAVFIKAVPSEDTVTRIILPTVDRLPSARDQLQVQEAGLKTMIALARWRSVNHRYPEALSELSTPERASATDLFGEGLLGYKLLDAKLIKPGDAYVLYSAGADGKDDDGRAAARPFDALRDDPAGDGTDFILNRQSW